MAKTIRRIKGILQRLDAIVLFGAGKDIRKPKPDRKWPPYCLARVDYDLAKALDRVDTLVFFRGRTVRTSWGRVRSRRERELVEFFRSANIKYVYEPKLRLGRKIFRPDFWLPEYGVYVEYWGLGHVSGYASKYRNNMRRKLKRYKAHNVPVVSIKPRDLANIRERFPELLATALKRKEEQATRS